MKEIKATLDNRLIPYNEIQLLKIEKALLRGVINTKIRISKNEQSDFKLMLKRASKNPVINHASIKMGNKRYSFSTDNQIMGLFEDFLQDLIAKGGAKFRTTNHHELKGKAEKLIAILSPNGLSQRKLYPAVYELISLCYPKLLGTKYENEYGGILKRDTDNQKTSHIKSILKQNTMDF